MIDNKRTYHEVDFLLPCQRFNIQFSYMSQRGLPFIREFMLRLIHITPVTKNQISVFFGLTQTETEAAVSDLMERGELTLSDLGNLVLTKKAESYFSELGAPPKVNSVQDSSTVLCFDLATFTCLGESQKNEKWKYGIPLNVDVQNISRSERLAEQQFQHQFYEILDNGYLPKSFYQKDKNNQEKNKKEIPSIYTVKSVNKLRQLPLRLTTEFQVDSENRIIERQDFTELKNSEIVHALITLELSYHPPKNNLFSLAGSMVQLKDEYTPKLFDNNGNIPINVQFLDDLNRLEEQQNSERESFLGPIYLEENWALLQKKLAPLLVHRIKTKTDIDHNQFMWIAPSDAFWGKSYHFVECVSDFLDKSMIKKANKKLYRPNIFLPISDKNDIRIAKQWKFLLEPYDQYCKGLVEGFLNGDVEIMYFENELVVVVYHLSQSPLPVTLPIGFISTNKNTVKYIGELVSEYIRGFLSSDNLNDCGFLSDIISHEYQKNEKVI